MKVKQQLTRKYYKYVTVESSWTQPVLSSNGTIGVDDFAVSATDDSENAYKALKDSNDFWLGYAGTSYIVYSNNALCIKRLGFQGVTILGLQSYINNFTFFGSNDGNSWENLGTFSKNSPDLSYFIINNNNFYKYYKIYINSVEGAGSTGWLEFIATQQTTTIAEGTKDDYDFYKDEIALNAFVDNNVYKAMKF